MKGGKKQRRSQYTGRAEALKNRTNSLAGLRSKGSGTAFRFATLARLCLAVKVGKKERRSQWTGRGRPLEKRFLQNLFCKNDSNG